MKKISYSKMADVVSAKRKEKRANAISGPEAFLLTSPITTFLIQNLPNAKKCSNYVFKKF